MPTKVILILWGLAGLAGCVPSLQTRVPDATVVRQRLVLLQVAVVALELQAGGNTVPQQEWASDIEERVRPVVKRLVVHNGGTVVSSEKLTACDEDEDCEDLLARFMRWSSRASMEILSGKWGAGNNRRHSVGDWRFKDDLSTLRDHIDSDQVLTVLFRTHRQTTGSAVVGLLTRRHLVNTQVVVACVTDLKDGRMIWCNTASGNWGDPSDSRPAQPGIEQLLNEIYGPFNATAPN